MWKKITNETPSDDRCVFAWHKECGVVYDARWKNRSFNLAWRPTHWMERPLGPDGQII